MNFTFGSDAARKRMLLKQEKAKQEAVRLLKIKEAASLSAPKNEPIIKDNMTIEEAKLAIKKKKS